MNPFNCFIFEMACFTAPNESLGRHRSLAAWCATSKTPNRSSSSGDMPESKRLTFTERLDRFCNSDFSAVVAPSALTSRPAKPSPGSQITLQVKCEKNSSRSSSCCDGSNSCSSRIEIFRSFNFCTFGSIKEIIWSAKIHSLRDVRSSWVLISR